MIINRFIKIFSWFLWYAYFLILNNWRLIFIKCCETNNARVTKNLSSIGVDHQLILKNSVRVQFQVFKKILTKSKKNIRYSKFRIWNKNLNLSSLLPIPQRFIKYVKSVLLFDWKECCDRNKFIGRKSLSETKVVIQLCFYSFSASHF